jgi:signal transduction histidine kinase
VTGAILLVVGLLLVMTWLASARIPGGATFARPGVRMSDPARAALLAPIHPSTWYALGAIALGPLIAGLAFALVLTLFSTGLTVLLAGVGVVFIVLGIEASRLLARVERWRAFAGETARPSAHAYRPFRGRLIDLARAAFLDESRWRDVVYVAIDFPVALIEAAVVLLAWLASAALLTTPLWYAGDEADLASVLGPTVGIVLLPLAATITQVAIALHRGLVTALLCTSESRELRREVQTLRESRSAVIDAEASELHRIERDLHDGAQQRLVMLTIDLGLAGERIDEDPAAAKQLIVEGQRQAREALAEIRQLVRGIAPSILVDRGLVAALESVVGRGPVPATLVSDLPPGTRLPTAAERAAYFVATEALANVAKHSGATRSEVRLRTDAGRLLVEVWDDGRGGARPTPGGGLAGLQSRVHGVDGTFEVTSPDGGPTTVRALIPLDGAAPDAATDPVERDAGRRPSTPREEDA